MTPYYTQEALLAYVAAVLALFLVGLAVGALGGLVGRYLTHAASAQTRTHAQQERRLRLISSIDRK